MVSVGGAGDAESAMAAATHGTVVLVASFSHGADHEQRCRERRSRAIGSFVPLEVSLCRIESISTSDHLRAADWIGSK